MKKIREDMENVAPPLPEYSGSSPRSAIEEDSVFTDRSVIERLRSGSIAKAAALYVGSCAGGDEYENNCAHYLSNAFLLAGSQDLGKTHSCIEARCGTPKERPIRARNMRCWFEKQATKSSRVPIKNDGFWAVFQLDELAYWGGHVAIIDSDHWSFYGTGWYDDWNQYWYKW